MRKFLFFTAIVILSIMHKSMAQTLFTAPDTVCVNQPVKLTNNFTTGSSYYWGFCSGNLLQTPTSVPPTGANLGDNFKFNLPGAIDVVKDSDNQYYGFVVNTGTRELIRLDYGTSLNNTPTYHNYGDLTNGLPVNPTSLYIVRDSAARHWHIFVTGGYDAATSSVARLDFGSKLRNDNPNVANFGNHTGLLNYPKGIFVAKDANGHWYGYLVNRTTSELIQLDFSFNVSNTPLMTGRGNIFNIMNLPTDLAAIRDGGNWYLFVTNYGSNTVSRIDLGPDLNPATITGSNLGNFTFRILRPSSISINRDCGGIYAYVTDSSSSQLVSIQMPQATGPYTAIDYNNVGFMNFPSGISSIIRDGDRLYGFITNTKDSTLTRILFNLCTNSSIPSYTEVDPPTYFYNTPGNYNVYYIVDQGLPTMQVDCKTIAVLPPPPMFRTPDTAICQHDTARLYVISNLSDSIRWQTVYNLDTSFSLSDSVLAYPEYDTTYRIKLFYPSGCIVDTNIRISVVNVVADAGPDRVIRDGAFTTLGGPNTSEGNYVYHWSPFNFMRDSTVPYATVFPPQATQYYLQVRDPFTGCKDIDTVNVQVDCGDFYVPNAFAPGSERDGVSKFGILNFEIARLNYFRIWDRWGVLMFETTDPTKRWDGVYNGKQAPQGVYVWEADGYCTSGVRVSKKGNVTLLR